MSENRDDSLEKKKNVGEKGPGSSEPAPATAPDQDIPSWLMISSTTEKERPAGEPGGSAATSAAAPELPAKVRPYEPPKGREPERKAQPESHRERSPQETRRAEPQVTPRQSPSATGPQQGGAVRTEPPRPERSRSEAGAGKPHRKATEEPEVGSGAFRRVTAETQAQTGSTEEHRDYREVVQEIQQHVTHGYSLLGLVGYSGSGKTHFLRALSLLLREQGFEAEAWESLRKALVPDYTEQSVFDYPCTGPHGEKWVFVDAAGEFYARLRSNDWELREESTALLHFLHYCRGLFLVLHLQPGHFRAGSLGTHRSISPQARAADVEAQRAQEEIEFFDRVLLFLRALKKESGKVEELVRRCAAAPSLDKALRSYRDLAPKLEFPIMVLFSQADTFDDSSLELATGSFLSPRKDTVNVAAFVARHLPGLYGSLVRHARRFKFDFVQSYEDPLLPGQFDEEGNPVPLPKWDIDREFLSVGALSALEFLQLNLPADPTKGRLQRILQRWELETRSTLFLNRLLHPKQWWGVKVRS